MKRRSLRIETDGRLAESVAALLPTTVDEATALVAAGAVYVAGKRARDAGLSVRTGQVVTVVLEESGRSALAPPEAVVPFEVLFEDADVIAVSKPAGVTAQPTPSREGDSLLDLVSRHVGFPAGLVHRLDRETSGVTVFGKSNAATSALAAQFREGSAHKQYLAVTGPGLPREGLVTLPLSKDPSRPGRWRASERANGISAETDYRRIHDDPAFCLVQLAPRTGRTHQLRAHLTALGCPILGDARYGGRSEAAGRPAGRCLLHARVLEVRHPHTDAPLRFWAPVPADMAVFLDVLPPEVRESV